MVDEKFRLALAELKRRRKAKVADLARAADRSVRQLQGVLSNTERKRLSIPASIAVAEFLGTTYEDMLSLGGELMAGPQEPMQEWPPAKPPFTPPSPFKPLPVVDDVVGMLRSVESHMREMDLRLDLGRAVFEAMPVAAVLIRDGIVVVQNLKSRLLGKAQGFPLCGSCFDTKCHGHRADCALQVAMVTHIEATEERVVAGKRYRVAATPLFIGGREHILMTAIDLDPVEDTP